ncbi:hypothetical protein [Arhodomonas sp. SL1]|uniref:hypothetical protein n=1 Tax=Arhodomonas sp. SL1 TaxID=3425691 RepID=UPI003F885C6F
MHTKTIFADRSIRRDSAAHHPEAGRQTLVLGSRLTAGLRSLLRRLGAEIAPVRWPGVTHPPVDRITIPTAATAPEWLDADATDELMGLLREMERLGTAPEWMQLLLARHRAGTLVDTDGCLELMDGLTPEAVICGLLRLPGRR